MFPATYSSCKSTWQAETIRRTCRDRVNVGTTHAYAIHMPIDGLVTWKDLLQVYMLYVLGFISGLAGGLGSRFMNRNNARGTLLGLSTLQHILDQARFVRSRVNVAHCHCQSRLLGLRQDAKMVYWSHVHERCQLLGLEAPGTPRRKQFPFMRC